MMRANDFFLFLQPEQITEIADLMAIPTPTSLPDISSRNYSHLWEFFFFFLMTNLALLRHVPFQFSVDTEVPIR